jgi:hypothetical protein
VVGIARPAIVGLLHSFDLIHFSLSAKKVTTMVGLFGFLARVV